MGNTFSSCLKPRVDNDGGRKSADLKAPLSSLSATAAPTPLSTGLSSSSGGVTTAGAAPFKPLTSRAIRRVAVVGAGAAGLPTARHLIEQGFEVVVFERLKASGGVWNYDPRPAPQPTFPSQVAIDSDPPYNPPPEVVEFPHVERYARADPAADPVRHSPPGPCYETLKNNVATPLVRYKDFDWPEGTKWYVPHWTIAKYLHDYAEAFGVHAATRYSTVVTNLEKVAGGASSEEDVGVWQLTSRTLVEDEDGIVVTWNRELFDAVVVASGHYHVPKVPDFPGLSEWRKLWPDRVIHSKSYRSPKEFEGDNILVIGNGASAIDIIRNGDTTAGAIYQSTRVVDVADSDIRRALGELLPSRLVRLPNVRSFHPPPASGRLEDAVVEFDDGTTVTGLGRVVLCTGYLFSHPFLDRLDNVAAERRRRRLQTRQEQEQEQKASDGDALPGADEIITTDGEWLQNLYHDIFYIPDPTLAFVGVPFHIATFSFFEFQAILLARVYAGKADLPPLEEQKRWFRERVERKGTGRAFHILGPVLEAEEVQALVDWVNRDAKKYGAPTVEGRGEDYAENKKRALQVYIAEAKASSA